MKGWSRAILRIRQHALALRPGREDFPDPFGPIGEDPPQPGANPQPVDQIPQGSERQLISDLVPHLHPLSQGREKVLVEPEPIRAQTLLVSKIIGLPDLGDLRQPGGSQQRKEPDLVGHELSLVRGQATPEQDRKIEIRRGDLVQIPWIRKKGPDPIEPCRDDLAPVKLI